MYVYALYYGSYTFIHQKIDDEADTKIYSWTFMPSWNLLQTFVNIFKWFDWFCLSIMWRSRYMRQFCIFGWNCASLSRHGSIQTSRKWWFNLPYSLFFKYFITFIKHMLCFRTYVWYPSCITLLCNDQKTKLWQFPRQMKNLTRPPFSYILEDQFQIISWYILL